MAPTTENNDEGKSGLTERETAMLIAAFVSLKDTSIDIEKFVKHSQFANANSARANFHGVKKKIFALKGEEMPSLVSAGTSTATTPRSRGKRAAKEVGDDDGDQEQKTPSKRARATPKKTKTNVVAEAADEASVSAKDEKVGKDDKEKVEGQADVEDK